MKNLVTILLAGSMLFFSEMAAGQPETDVLNVRSFDKVVASPKIDLVLLEGDEESVRLEYSGVDRDRIMVEVTGRKLHIYLENAKIVERPVRVYDGKRKWRYPMYKRASVTAYVTYRQLEGIEIRGNGTVFCESDIDARKFKLKAYGENEIRIPMLTASKLKTKLYGVNNVRIGGGQVGHQKHVSYGESKIDTRRLDSRTAATTVYGEGRIMLRATDEVHVTSFGEPNFIVEGSPIINKGLIFGNARIRKY